MKCTEAQARVSVEMRPMRGPDRDVWEHTSVFVCVCVCAVLHSMVIAVWEQVSKSFAGTFVTSFAPLIKLCVRFTQQQQQIR